MSQMYQHGAHEALEKIGVAISPELLVKTAMPVLDPVTAKRLGLHMLGGALAGGAGGAIAGGPDNRLAGGAVGGILGGAVGAGTGTLHNRGFLDKLVPPGAAQRVVTAGVKEALALSPRGIRYAGSAAGGAATGAAVGALTGEDGTRGSRALKGGLMGGAGGLAFQGASDAALPHLSKLPASYEGLVMGNGLPLAGAAVGAGAGAMMADEGHAGRGAVLGGLGGLAVGGIPRNAMEAPLQDALMAQRMQQQAARAAKTAVASVRGTRRPFDVADAGQKTGGFALPEGITPAMALSPLIGGALGAGTGALVDDENRGRGALIGGALGGAAGLANSYGLGLRKNPIYEPPAMPAPEEWEGIVDVLKGAQPAAKQAAFRAPPEGSERAYSALKTLGGGALGALTGFGLADEDHRGAGAVFGGLGGAANVHLLQNQKAQLDLIKDAPEVRKMLGRIGPSTLGATVGAIAGNRYSSDENAGAGTLMGGMYGAALGGVGANGLMDASDLYYDIKNMRGAAKAYRNAVKGYKVEPYIAPPMKALAENASKTASTFLNMGTPEKALAARYGLGALAGGAMGYATTDEEADPERRAANTLLGGVLGAGVSGATKHLSNWRLDQLGKTHPLLNTAVDTFKSELL